MLKKPTEGDHSMPTRRKPKREAEMTKATTGFLNVDLDLRFGRGPRSELMRFMKSRMLLVHSEKGFATFEHSDRPATVQDGVLLVARILRTFPPRVRAQWNRCRERTMNIGIQAGETPHQARFALRGDALEALKEVGADLLLTVYAPPR